MNRRRLLQLSPGAGLLLAGCHSAPPARYFRLSPVAGVPLQTSPAAVRVRDISIPGYLDQDGIAEPSGQYQFMSSANDLWAEPLGGMLQTVLVQDLAQRLPQMTVTASSGMIGAPADLLVEINVLRFDPDASGRLFLNAQIALKAAKENRFLATRMVQNDIAPNGADTPDMMAAMSMLWAGLADRVAVLVSQNPPSAAP